MNWVNKINNALTYVEDNICSEIELDEVAELVDSSLYHFLRIFNVLTGKTLGSYIKERRLSLASKDVTNTSDKISEIAYRYVYESPEAFSRAFKRFHGISPQHARINASSLKAVPPLHIEFALRGFNEIDFVIERKEAFYASGVSVRTSAEKLAVHNDVSALWQAVFQNDEFDLLEQNSGPLGVMGISYDRIEADSDSCFSYMVGIEGRHKVKDSYKTIYIPPQTWAVFPGSGVLPEAIIELRCQIYSQWFSATSYYQAIGPDIEIYKSHEDGIVDFELWIPVVCFDSTK